jgi:general secretion pathway protein G
MLSSRAFTLIELLIVVAIIAILAAIAVPNFLEAQTRAKISRARADLRSAVTALEAYRIDNNAYPFHRGPDTTGSGFGEVEDVHVLNGYGSSRLNGFRTLSLRLSTPIAYITSSALIDPFKTGAVDRTGERYESGDPTDVAYGYHNIYQYAILQGSASGFPEDDFNRDYGFYRLFSLGPDRYYNSWGTADRGWIYDPTNGTISSGYVIRTQLDPVGENLAVPD